MVVGAMCAYLSNTPRPEKSLMQFRPIFVCLSAARNGHRSAPRPSTRDQCWWALLGGGAAESSAGAAGTPLFTAAGFSHSHGLPPGSCDALSFLCAAWPNIIAGIIAAMQPERNKVPVSTPIETIALGVFMTVKNLHYCDSEPKARRASRTLCPATSRAGSSW